MKFCVFALFLSVTMASCQSSAVKSEKPPRDTVISLVPPPSQLTPEEMSKYHNLVSNFVNHYLSEQNFNGGILVAKNGVVVYERYTGFSNFKTKDSMTADTPLQVASTGKTLTSGAILKLVQEGKMGLDDLVTKYFPAFPYPEITVKMLLNHRSGLPNYLYYLEKMKINRRNQITNEDVLNSLVTGNVGRAYAAGKHYNYCNTNYVLLALILEKVTGIPYPQYMADNFFKPLNMTHTFVKTKADSANVAYSYKRNKTLWVTDFSDGPYGDKNIYSTPRDLLKWDQALYAGRLINPTLLDSAFKPYSNEKPGVKNYGLGWHLLIMPNGKKVIFHNGKWHGFNAVFARLTDEKVTIIMTCNKDNMGIYQISKKMYNLFGPYDGRGDDGGAD